MSQKIFNSNRSGEEGKSIPNLGRNAPDQGAANRTPGKRVSGVGAEKQPTGVPNAQKSAYRNRPQKRGEDV